MSKLVYLVLIYSISTSIQFIQAFGDDKKNWSNVQNDQLRCKGFEWHPVIENENFFKDLQLTKNVFDYNSKEKSQFKIDPDIVKKKIKDLPLEYLMSTGYSFSIYFRSDGSTKASYLIEHESDKGDPKKNLIDKDNWQTISGTKEYQNKKELDIDKIVNFIVNIKVTGNQDKPIYFAISNLTNYLKFKIKNDDGSFREETISFYFNKGTLEYQVRIDDKLNENLNDFDYWTSLNFEGVLTNNLKHIAVSKFHNSLMVLEFKINELESNFENSSICVKFKYYHDNGNDDDLPTFEILTKLRGSKDDDETKIRFNKLIDYIINSKTGSNNLEIVKSWLTLKLCFHKKYLKDNVIYLMSNIKKESQKGQNPSLTNALADFEIERSIEHFNDFLYAWDTGLFNIEDEWHATPILDNFKLIKNQETKQTYLELINQPNSKINVYHLISNAFEILKDAKLTFRLNNNHTDGTLKIYLIEDTKNREKIAQFSLSDIQDNEKYIVVNVTKSKTDNDPTFTAVDVEDDDEEEISDYKNILQNINLNVEKLDSVDNSDDEKKDKEEEDKGDDDKGGKDKEDEDKGDKGDKDNGDKGGKDKGDKDKGDKDKGDKDKGDKDDKDKEKPDDDKKKPNKPDDKTKQPEKSYAKLIFEFKLKRLEKDENPERLQLYGLNLGDPCQLKHDKCRYGTCISHTAKKWSCKCDENAHGPNCEFTDMCKKKLEKEYIEKHKLKVPPKDEIGDKILNGDFYCEYRTGKSKSCLPIDDRIKCVCEKGQVFDYKTQNCQALDVCAFSYCSENEECQEDKKNKKPVCKCKKNYHRNEFSDKCELDYCRLENGKSKCNDMQDCINDLVNEKAVCECKNGFKQYGSDCVPILANDEKTPFIKQFYSCDHTYELSSDKKEYKCACFDGYKLDQDKKTCKPEFDEKKCPKCSIKEVCIRPDPNLPNELKCACKLGYNGVSKSPCEPHFCLDKSKSALIRPTCPTIGNCSLLMVRRTEPIFQCSCKTELHIANKKNGLCELKQVCNLFEQNKCAEKNGLCIPKLINGSLVAACECSLGFGKDKNTDTCVPLDELLDCRKKFNAFTKYININKNKAICACLPGYEFDQLKRKCILSTKDTIKISTVVFLKRLSDELDRYEIPENLYIDKKNQLNKIKIFNCSTSKLLTKRHCYSEINSAFEPLTKLNKSLMMKNIEYQLYQKVRTLFHFISGDDSLSISMIRFENVTEINENEDGFNTKYLVEIAIISNDKNEGNKLQKNLKRLCSENEGDDKDDNEYNKLKNFCYLNKQMLPISKELSLFGQLDLCDLSTKKIQCPAYSSCKHEIKTDLNQENKNRYTCVCDKGFKSLHKIEEYNLDIEICEDVDECKEEKDGKKNECGDNTECENLIGSYRCNCLEKFKRSTDKVCVPTCTKSFPCVEKQGECKVFEKNYEICHCYDGYKGIDCSKEDSVVILLKEILVFVSVGLGLMLIVTIGISIFCIKSVRKQKNKGDEQIHLDDLK